ncbi:GGDEF domain-containing protein, partial [bacterium]|nr:GGDEF domain-containing protein [bacterium]
DIDHFKQVNDTYGHLDGDLVLSQLSALLKKYVRISDIIFRYGGEEFAVILPDTSESDAAILARRLCKSTEENTFYLKKKRIRLTVTVGVSELTNEIYTPKMMIETADSALYWGKENGRNRVICYSEIKEKR